MARRCGRAPRLVPRPDGLRDDCHLVRLAPTRRWRRRDRRRAAGRRSDGATCRGRRGAGRVRGAPRDAPVLRAIQRSHPVAARGPRLGGPRGDRVGSDPAADGGTGAARRPAVPRGEPRWRARFVRGGRATGVPRPAVQPGPRRLPRAVGVPRAGPARPRPPARDDPRRAAGPGRAPAAVRRRRPRGLPVSRGGRPRRSIRLGPTGSRPRQFRPRVPRRPRADGGVAVNIASVREVGGDLLDAVETVIVGKRAVLERVLWAILGDGHLLIEDVPGLAKTLIAKSFAAGLGLSFRRIQFTPDLLPADITGTYVFDRKTGDFVLRRGPVFTNVLLADEINRAPPKTQSALLEAMQERQATLEGETFHLDRPFFVIATQNPIEHEGTYPLPEAQVDRCLLKIDVGYPTREQEIEVIDRRRKRHGDDASIDPVTTPEEIRSLQAAIEDVHVEPVIEGYMVDIVAATRAHTQVEVGASPRGSLALLKVSRARAAIAGRDFVTPDDVKAVAMPALAHRIILKPDPWIRGVRTSSVLADVLSEVAVPKVP